MGASDESAAAFDQSAAHCIVWSPFGCHSPSPMVATVSASLREHPPGPQNGAASPACPKKYGRNIDSVCCDRSSRFGRFGRAIVSKHTLLLLLVTVAANRRATRPGCKDEIDTFNSTDTVVSVGSCDAESLLQLRISVDVPLKSCVVALTVPGENESSCTAVDGLSRTAVQLLRFSIHTEKPSKGVGECGSGQTKPCVRPPPQTEIFCKAKV